MATKTKGVQKRVRELSPGMKLAKPAHSRSGSRLFDEGTKLTGADIDKLKNWNVRSVYVAPDS